MKETIENKAKEITAKFPHISMEKAMKMAEKELSKKGWKAMSDKEIAKVESRNTPSTTTIYDGMDMGEINRFNAMRNLPSSLR